MQDKLITLATDHYTAAEVLRARLESAGIEVYLKHVNLLQAAVSEGVQVQIRSSDVEKALMLMSEWKARQEATELQKQKNLRRILVPVDFSDYSRNACHFALQLARIMQTDIKILHVYYAPIVDLVPITDAYSIQVDMDINLREVESKARKELTAFVAQIRQQAREQDAAEVKISYALKEGIPEDQIARMAKEYKPGLIVMGSRGKGEKQSDLIGGVVKRLLDKTRVPLLVIPEQAAYEPGKEVRRVVYATDFDDTDYLALRRLFQILSGFDFRLHCLHLSRESDTRLHEARMEAFRQYVDKIHTKAQMQCEILRGEDNLKQMDEYTSAHQIDLIALTKRKRNIISRWFNPGLTRRLLIHSRIPLLIFRA